MAFFLYLQQKSYTGRKFATFDEIRERIKLLCEEEGILIHGSEVLGLTPMEAYQKTIDLLSKGNSYEPSAFDEHRM